MLEKHPPSVGRVLKLDPSLMRSESYLAAYPELRDFLTQHSEVPQNSQYYLEGVRVSPNDGYQRNDKLELAAAVLAGFAAFTAGAASCWDAGLVDPHRPRAAPLEPALENPGGSPLQADGSIFVERRALTYVQTPSGRRFLESGPSPLQQDMPPADGGAALEDPVVDAARRRPAGRRPWTAVPERAGVVRNRRSSSTSPGAWPPRSGPDSWSRRGRPMLSRQLGLLDRPDRHTPGAAENHA